MTWPLPQPGLVIRYSDLWHREAVAGRDEGVKDRPCAVVLAVQDDGGRFQVYALPITHSAPASGDEAIEIPLVVKARLGLDGERSWVSVNEANVFRWPGPDLRFLPGKGPGSAAYGYLLPGKGPGSAAYGYLPPGFFRVVRERFLAIDRSKKPALVRRTE